jgi:hypothetical protein
LQDKGREYETAVAVVCNLVCSPVFAQSPEETPEQYKERICSVAPYDDTGLLRKECERIGGHVEIQGSSREQQHKQGEESGRSNSLSYPMILFLAVLLGLIPASIARSRGHSFIIWWAFGALIFIVALPCSLFLKERGSQKRDVGEKGPIESEPSRRPAPIVGIVATGLGLASVVVPYFAAVFFAPAALITAVIALIRRQTGWGIAGLLLGLLSLAGIAYTSQQIFDIFNGGAGRTSLSQPTFASPPIVTREKYDQIHEGMTYRQVCDIIGSSGEEVSRSDMAGVTTVMYSWTNSNASNMNAMFQNNRLISKSQFGLP